MRNNKGTTGVSVFVLLTVLVSCSVQKKIEKAAQKDILNANALTAAHIGISVYEPATGKYLFNHQGDKYFVPASNTKIPTCYVAMKYLGDSLVGLRYNQVDNEYTIYATGDPSFLLPEYTHQPVYDFLKNSTQKGNVSLGDYNWKDRHWGSGWSWTDYDETYMAERSPFPIYGNLVKFIRSGKRLYAIPSLFDSTVTYRVDPSQDSMNVQRAIATNSFEITRARTALREITIPFVTQGYTLTNLLLRDTLRLNSPLRLVSNLPKTTATMQVIHSQPTDSLLKPMMHRSDNFFAEQSLLMVSNERLGVMSDDRIIDTILKTDFIDLPQKPRWVDGSGLSRYNLFTPQDMVIILKKMNAEFGMQRVKTIFATGGQGTISSYYKNLAGKVYAKTGTLSGVVALSGFLTTKHDRQLIFSVLVNNHQGSATDVRRAVERFINQLYTLY